MGFCVLPLSRFCGTEMKMTENVHTLFVNQDPEVVSTFGLGWLNRVQLVVAYCPCILLGGSR